MAETPKNLDEVLELMPAQFQADAAKGFKAIYQYCVSGEGGKDFYQDIDDGKLDLQVGKHDSPNITISIDHQDFLKMLSDPSAGQALFMQGKVKVEPLDMSLMMKMGTLFKND
ncbi:MAG: SCP2 sterol-binding domain-containing protein [Myxococcales bacterium]|nr:SCP2 sterol-binding domain-containing protein [Myxococcales bacterium]